MTEPRTYPLICRQCGGPLPVSAGERIMTCSHCEVTLVVEWPAGTNPQSEIANEELCRELEVMRIREELRQIDAEWERDKRATEVAASESGAKRAPVAVPQWQVAVLPVLLLMGFLIFAVDTGEWLLVPAGIVVAPLGYLAAEFFVDKERRLVHQRNRAKRRHAAARVPLLARLHELTGDEEAKFPDSVVWALPK